MTPSHERDNLEYRILTDSVDAVLVLDRNGVVRYANPAAKSLFDERVEEGLAFGTPLSADRDPELTVSLKDGTVKTVEMRVGESMWQGEPSQVVTFRDVTERNEMRDRLNHVNLVLKAIRNINQLIVHEKDPRALIQTACDMLIESRGYEGAWMAIGDGEGEPKAVAYSGWTEHVDSFVTLLEQGSWPPCVADALPSTIDVAVFDPLEQCGACPLGEAYGHRLGVVTAMRHRDAVLGVMGVSLGKDIFLDDQERSLLHEVASDIAFALHDIDIDQRRMKAEEKTIDLLEANRAALSAPTFDVAAHRIFDLCKDRTGATAGYVAVRLSREEDRILFLDVGRTRSTVDQTRILTRGGLRAETYRCNRVVIDNDVPDKLSARLLPETDVSLTNVMLSPISVAGDARGIIVLANKDKAFDEEDAQTVQAFGEVVAIALQREQYLEALSAKEDMLTSTGRMARVGGWELDAKTKDVTWTEVTREIHEVSEDFVPTLEKALGFFPMEERPRLQAALEEALTSGTPYDLKVRFVTALGRELWTRSKCQPVEKGGRIDKLLGTFQDITESKRLEDSLRKEKERAQRYLDVAATMLLGLDTDARITLINRRGREILDVDDDIDLLGRLWFDFIPSDERDAVRNVFHKTIHGELDEVRRVEARIETAKGEIRRIVWHNAVVFDAAGTIVGTLSSGEDVTELRDKEAQLNQADRLSSMGLLAAGVAHEVNNPLAFVLYNLESLEADAVELVTAAQTVHEYLSGRDDLEDEAGPLAKAVQVLHDFLTEDAGDRLHQSLEGSRRIKEIIRGLNTFSRVDEHDVKPVDINEVIEAAVNMAHNEIRHRARLIKDYGEVPPVMACEGRLAQVFLNLLINATHAIPEGNPDRHQIRVATRRSDDFLVAEVQDTGSGIAPDHIKKLFDPFFTTKKVGVGSGLGLAITYDILKSLDGSINVTSELGRGSCFTIRLPIKTAELEAEEEKPKIPATEDEVNGRVLAIDDEAQIRAIMARMLPGHDVVEAESGAEGKRILEKDRAFDVILCDMMMPDVSGMDLHRWLTSAYPKVAQRFVFVTGGAFTPRAQEYLKQVDVMRLEKPFDVGNFKKTVNDRIQRAKRENDGS